MAHGDYHCCALCDCKMDYCAYDARTKEDLCVDCLKVLHGEGIIVYNGAELASWIQTNPSTAAEKLPKLGYSPCFYGNPVDAAMKCVCELSQ